MNATTEAARVPDSVSSPRRHDLISFQLKGIVTALLIIVATMALYHSREANRADERARQIAEESVLAAELALEMLHQVDAIEAAMLRYTLGEASARTDYFRRSEQFLRLRSQMPERDNTVRLLQEIDRHFDLLQNEAKVNVFDAFSPNADSVVIWRLDDLYEARFEAARDQLLILGSQIEVLAATHPEAPQPPQLVAAINRLAHGINVAGINITSHTASERSLRGLRGQAVLELDVLKAGLGGIGTAGQETLLQELAVEVVDMYDQSIEILGVTSQRYELREAEAATLNISTTVVNQLSESLEELADLKGAEALSETESLSSQLSQIAWTTPATMVLLLVGVILAYALIRMRVLLPLVQLGELLADTGRGERSLAIPEASKADEVGLIFASVRDLRHSLASLEAQARELHESTEAEHVAKLERALDELSNKEKQLQDEAKKLEDANVELEQFVHVASHDLREPLRKLYGFTQRIELELESVLTDGSRASIGHLYSGVQRMQELLDGLRDLSRANETSLAQERFSLEELIESVFEEQGEQARTLDMTLECDPLPEVIGHRPLVRQLFSNMVVNAMRHGVHPSTLQISRRSAPAGRLGLRVANGSTDGTFAFETEDQDFDRLFLPFTRGETRSDGVGMGLTICRKVVEAHGGTIVIDTSQPREFALVFDLPIGG